MRSSVLIPYLLNSVNHFCHSNQECWTTRGSAMKLLQGKCDKLEMIDVAVYALQVYPGSYSFSQKWCRAIVYNCLVSFHHVF